MVGKVSGVFTGVIMGDASMEVGGVLEVSSHSFFKMHQIPCDYEKRDPADVMPLDKVREGLRHLNVRINTFYDRPEPSVQSAGGNSAFASGTGAASFLKRGQILTSVKLLKRLCQEGLDSPVFFVSHLNSNFLMLASNAKSDLIKLFIISLFY